jgi:hypothetical protein
MVCKPSSPRSLCFFSIYSPVMAGPLAQVIPRLEVSSPDTRIVVITPAASIAQLPARSGLEVEKRHA